MLVFVAPHDVSLEKFLANKLPSFHLIKHFPTGPLYHLHRRTAATPSCPMACPEKKGLVCDRSKRWCSRDMFGSVWDSTGKIWHSLWRFPLLPLANKVSRHTRVPSPSPTGRSPCCRTSPNKPPRPPCISKRICTPGTKEPKTWEKRFERKLHALQQSKLNGTSASPKSSYKVVHGIFWLPQLTLSSTADLILFVAMDSISLSLQSLRL